MNFIVDRKYAMLAIVIMLMVCTSAFSQIVVLDKTDNHPVAAVSVYNNDDGSVVGTTNFNGELPVRTEGLKNISLHHINYYNQDVDLGKVENGKIFLTPYVHEIQNVNVTKGNADYVRMKVYIRQYSVLNNQPAYFRESLAYLYFDVKDIDDKPSFKRISENIYRNKGAFEGKSNVLKSLAMIDNPCQFASFDLYKCYTKLKKENRVRSRWQRGGGFMYMNEDEVNHRCEIVLDSLLADKPYNVPLFGFSFGNIYECDTYSTVYGTPTMVGLQNTYCSFRFYHNKSKEFVDNFIDIYVLGAEYVSKEQKKADKKAKPIGFIAPGGMPPLNENIVKALKSMTRIQ